MLPESFIQGVALKEELGIRKILFHKASGNTFKSSYSSAMHVIWDAVFAISVPSLYIVFAIIFFAKSNGLKNEKISKPQKMMLLQVTSISVLNVGCVSTYLYMTYFVPSKLFMHFAQYCYLHMHGFPPVIYLLFNTTIRKDAKQMLKKLSFKKKSPVINDSAKNYLGTLS
uniref:Very-long-chain 3-oxoacyl-CoA synthase n=1 Tax=Ditylenchus dipsaci TaxID=166011 RepID=A0A915E7V5_9BILA